MVVFEATRELDQLQSIEPFIAYEVPPLLARQLKDVNHLLLESSDSTFVEKFLSFYSLLVSTGTLWRLLAIFLNAEVKLYRRCGSLSNIRESSFGDRVKAVLLHRLVNCLCKAMNCSIECPRLPLADLRFVVWRLSMVLRSCVTS